MRAAPRIGALAAALLGGCGVDTTCVVRPCVAPRQLEVYEGEPSLETLSFGCCLPSEDPSCGVEGAWWVSAVSEGTLTRATLELRTGGLTANAWVETHPLPIIDRDPQGFWEERGDELVVLDTEGCFPLASCGDRVTLGVNTLFTCDPADPDAELRATLRLYADGASSPFACHTWGGVGAVPTGCVATTPTF
ncbi:MAG: hypothetical protein JNM72_23375 [Deltaproteobacteria bacterium]|nr:hypothetical protein [Deltaproteobacteria bacterium]